MRISDWSADVCSSDLVAIERTGKCGGHQPFAPNFIATAIIADASRYTHRDEARGGEGRNCSGGLRGCVRAIMVQQRSNRNARTEEHTSELQSLMRISYAVFCLKKKNDAQQKVQTVKINKHTKHRDDVTHATHGQN